MKTFEKNSADPDGLPGEFHQVLKKELALL